MMRTLSTGLVCLLFVASALAQSARPGLGSIPYADAGGTGVTFRVWAPNATSVGVKGQFSGWAMQIFAFVGVNNRQTAVDVPLTKLGARWHAVFDILFDTFALDLAFHDGAVENRICPLMTFRP